MSKRQPITKENISEMEKFLNHLHFETNKSIAVKLSVDKILKQYKVKNQQLMVRQLVSSGVIERFGNKGRGISYYKWKSTEKPSKMMARRVIESCSNFASELSKSNWAKKQKIEKAITVSNSKEQITREEFEKRVEKINKETGMYAEEFKKIKELKGKQIKVEQPQPKHVEPIQKQETESVSLFWGLYTRTKNI